MLTGESPDTIGVAGVPDVGFGIMDRVISIRTFSEVMSFGQVKLPPAKPEA
jgi:hypothetical protein